MKNERMYAEMMDATKKEAEKDLATIRGWKSVGRNYATKKNGEPFVDPVKSFQGVDGIAKAERGKTWRGDSFARITNTEGQEMDITGMTLPQIEDRIAETIARAEKDYNFRANMLDRLSDICEKCDKAMQAVFDTLPENSDLHSIYATQDCIEKYMKDTMQDKIILLTNAALEREFKEAAQRERQREQRTQEASDNRSSLDSLIGNAEVENHEAPEAAEASREDMER